MTRKVAVVTRCVVRLWRPPARLLSKVLPDRMFDALVKRSSGVLA